MRRAEYRFSVVTICILAPLVAIAMIVVPGMPSHHGVLGIHSMREVRNWKAIELDIFDQAVSISKGKTVTIQGSEATTSVTLPAAGKVIALAMVKDPKRDESVLFLATDQPKAKLKVVFWTVAHEGNRFLLKRIPNPSEDIVDGEIDWWRTRLLDHRVRLMPELFYDFEKEEWTQN